MAEPETVASGDGFVLWRRIARIGGVSWVERRGSAAVRPAVAHDELLHALCDRDFADGCGGQAYDHARAELLVLQMIAHGVLARCFVRPRLARDVLHEGLPLLLGRGVRGGLRSGLAGRGAGRPELVLGLAGVALDARRLPADLREDDVRRETLALGAAPSGFTAGG